MPAQEDLAVQYHQQDTDYYCGAACAQMVLAQQEVGAGLLDQDDLYADNHNHSTTEGGWYTGPDGLTWTLNDRRPAGFTNAFVLFALTNEELISRKICWTIHHYKVAPIAMVFGSAHWIVVRGYDASHVPAAVNDNSYTITAFDVNNPWPPTPSPTPPPPHDAGDDCGTGGVRGVANEHITYATWQDDYMTGISGGYWTGKFVAVCDPEPPGKRTGPTRRPADRLPGDRLIEPQEAARRAETGLEEHGLYERSHWRGALRDTRPGEPVLVQRLDHLDRFYYIVPMQATEERVPVLASVDARFGDYRQAVALPEHGSHLLADINERELLERLVGNKFELEDRLGRVLVRREALCLYPTLVWKPCRESLSPFWPFYMITIGAHRLYLRIDGAVFTELHADQHGI
jgi:hypothetical protein